MRKNLGRYKVTGDVSYRGHQPGTEFVARLDVYAARRAIERGSITLLGLEVDKLEPGTYRLPHGWINEDRR